MSFWEIEIEMVWINQKLQKTLVLLASSVPYLCKKKKKEKKSLYNTSIREQLDDRRVHINLLKLNH